MRRPGLPGKGVASEVGVRKRAVRFTPLLIVVGHEIPDVETVIETHGDWCVIEKDPSVGDLLKASDPRRQ